MNNFYILNNIKVTFYSKKKKFFFYKILRIKYVNSIFYINNILY